MNILKAGTPCYLVNLVDHCEHEGFVVEVVSGPFLEADGGEDFYVVDSDWARATYPGRAVHAVRSHLKPIVPPEPLKTERQKEVA